VVQEVIGAGREGKKKTVPGRNFFLARPPTMCYNPLALLTIMFLIPKTRRMEQGGAEGIFPKAPWRPSG
jgi:hypothetical protein